MINDDQIKSYFADDGCVNFAEQYLLDDGKPIELLDHQKRILSDIFSKDADGKFKYRIVVYSSPKKGGKTELASLVGLWYALTQEANNEIYVSTNSYEQSKSRAFKRMVKAIESNPNLSISARIMKDQIIFTNGTVVKALASAYDSAAGSLVGLSLTDELAFYTTESDRRLYEELTPIQVPSRINSMRFITSTAGFLNESKLLYSLYERAVINGERLYTDLPIWTDDDLYFYYETDPMAVPWITENFLQGQRKDLRKNQYLRLWQNQWVASESSYISIDEWKSCERKKSEYHGEVVVGVDLATRRDGCGLCAVAKDDGKIRVVNHKFFLPSRRVPVDLADIEKVLLDWHRRYTIRKIRYDPFQAEFLMSRIKHKIGAFHVEPLNQTSANLERCANQLLSAVRDNRLVVYKSDTFREQIQNAIATETARGGFRITKSKQSRKIDLIAALSFAIVGLEEMPHTQHQGRLFTINYDKRTLCPINKKRSYPRVRQTFRGAGKMGDNIKDLNFSEVKNNVKRVE